MEGCMKNYPFLKERYAFTVCRIEPENNIAMVLEAFSGSPALPLAVVGNWDHSEYGRRLRQKYGDVPHVFMLDPIYEPSELNALRGGCSAYIHGHSCGGTNPSLIEAMFLGLAVIAFDVNFNRETTENSALYFDSAERLAGICTGLDEKTIKRTGAKMKEIADRRYTWKRICELYAKLF